MMHVLTFISSSYYGLVACLLVDKIILVWLLRGPLLARWWWFCLHSIACLPAVWGGGRVVVVAVRLVLALLLTIIRHSTATRYQTKSLA